MREALGILLAAVCALLMVSMVFLAIAVAIR